MPLHVASNSPKLAHRCFTTKWSMNNPDLSGNASFVRTIHDRSGPRHVPARSQSPCRPIDSEPRPGCLGANRVSVATYSPPPDDRGLFPSGRDPRGLAMVRGMSLGSLGRSQGEVLSLRRNPAHHASARRPGRRRVRTRRSPHRLVLASCSLTRCRKRQKSIKTRHMRRRHRLAVPVREAHPVPPQWCRLRPRLPSVSTVTETRRASSTAPSRRADRSCPGYTATTFPAYFVTQDGEGDRVRSPVGA